MESGMRDNPKISFRLRDHKIAILVTWTVLFLGSGIFPVVLYFTIRYAAHAKIALAVGIPVAAFGVPSIFFAAQRTWRLLRNGDLYRPLGAKAYHFDFFHWNFLIGFAYITAVCVLGPILKSHPRTAVRIISLPLSLLLVQVCTQLVLLSILVPLGIRYPFRISSMTPGTPCRPAVYTIAEDIVAVDGGEGKRFRAELDARYSASPEIRSLLHHLDLLWGISGLAIAIAIILLIALLHDPNVGFVIGWLAPWAWAAMTTTLTFFMTSKALKKEASRQAMI